MAPTPVDSDVGPSATTCAWKALDGTVGIDLVANYGVGLELLDRVGDVLAARQPLTVAGYPAVRIDEPGSPTCRIVVGVADTQAFSAEASSLTTDAPPLCDLALALAEETVAALRGP
jgi:hypothetical protein